MKSSRKMSEMFGNGENTIYKSNIYLAQDLDTHRLKNNKKSKIVISIYIILIIIFLLFIFYFLSVC
jgi:uncharacterized membrane protein YvbJ